MSRFLQIYYFWPLIIVLLTKNSYGQKTDTVIEKQIYLYSEYYPQKYERIGLESDCDKILFCLGNFMDSQKNGKWIYFYPSGKILATGNYINGIKVNRWKYYTINGDFAIINFLSKFPTSEKIIFSEYNYPEIIDIIQEGFNPKYLVNGLIRRSGNIILD